MKNEEHSVNVEYISKTEDNIYLNTDYINTSEAFIHNNTQTTQTESYNINYGYIILFLSIISISAIVASIIFAIKSSYNIDYNHLIHYQVLYAVTSLIILLNSLIFVILIFVIKVMAKERLYCVIIGINTIVFIIFIIINIGIEHFYPKISIVTKIVAEKREEIQQNILSFFTSKKWTEADN